jgi:hypothetical protein
VVTFGFSLSLIIAFVEMGSSKRVLQGVPLFFFNEGMMVSGQAFTV